MKTVTYYFDPISPYVHMAFHGLPAFLKRNQNVQIKYVPVLFAGLLNAHGQKGPAEIAAKRVNVMKEILRFGKILGIQMKLPPQHPYNPLTVLRILTSLGEGDECFKLANIFSKASWEEGLDISDANVVRSILMNNKYDADALLAKANDLAIKNKLKENTDKAINQNVFGVPSFVVDDEVFWGNDRLEHLELYLQGKLDIDRKLFQEMMNRPRGADRKQI
ncbi:2-hydroxychromene-2-carboxylate isomerase [bacterium]|nr:2-hydroxychromene-2-carboxylate isomerase [bacterium]